MAHLLRKTNEGRGQTVSPEVKGRERYYRIEVASGKFIQLRYVKAAHTSGVWLVRGQKQDGSWVPAAWLVDKRQAEVMPSGRLVIYNELVLDNIEGPIHHVQDGIYRAHPKQ